MKTPHRIMYEVLTPKQYKQFCTNLESRKVRSLLPYKKPAVLLFEAFRWSQTAEGYTYWNNVHTRLYKS